MLLLLKSISFRCWCWCCCCHCCYCCIFSLLIIIIIIRCYRTFSLAHTNTVKMTRRFFVWRAFSLSFSFQLFLAPSLPLFTIDYISLDTTFYAQVFCIFTLNIEHRTNTCLGIQFTFFSFRRFLDIYFDFCPNNEAFAEPLSCYVLRDLKCLINFYFV